MDILNKLILLPILKPCVPKRKFRAILSYVLNNDWHQLKKHFAYLTG